jgi:hypothetical protein
LMYLVFYLEAIENKLNKINKQKNVCVSIPIIQTIRPGQVRARKHPPDK